MENEPTQGDFVEQGEPTQHDPASQADISSVDISTLDPAIQDTIKAFQSDYTKKTQEIANQRKQLEIDTASARILIQELTPLAQEREKSAADIPKKSIEDFSTIAEYDAYVEKRTQDLVELKFSELAKQMNPLVEDSFERKILEQEKQLIAKNPEAADYVDSIYTELSKNPSLSFDDAFILAQARNPKTTKKNVQDISTSGSSGGTAKSRSQQTIENDPNMSLRQKMIELSKLSNS